MTPPGQSAAMIAVADTRAPAERLTYEWHAGSGPRGSHHGQDPNPAVPDGFCCIPVSVPAACCCAAAGHPRESHPHHRHQDVV
jgi:hypothetical protein